MSTQNVTGYTNMPHFAGDSFPYSRTPSACCAEQRLVVITIAVAAPHILNYSKWLNARKKVLYTGTERCTHLGVSVNACKKGLPFGL